MNEIIFRAIIVMIIVSLMVYIYVLILKRDDLIKENTHLRKNNVDLDEKLSTANEKYISLVKDNYKVDWRKHKKSNVLFIEYGEDLFGHMIIDNVIRPNVDLNKETIKPKFINLREDGEETKQD